MFDLRRLGTITDPQERWAPERLRAAISARAAQLRSAGVKPGDRVLITAGNHGRFFVDLFAVWSCRACAAVLSAGATPLERDNVMRFLEPAATLTGDEPLEEGAPLLEITALEADDPALILFTSGTTGDPKGVLHTGGSLSRRIGLNQAHIPKDHRTRTLCPLATHFGHGLIGNSLSPLLDGDHLFVGLVQGAVAQARLGAIIDEHEITFMSSVPALWRVALRLSKPPARGTLKRVHIGSAPLAKNLMGKIAAFAEGAEVYNMYGITETANWISGARYHPSTTEDGDVGAPWGGEAAVLIDGVVQTQGEGEVIVRTPSLMPGYYQRPDLTEAVMIDGWYRTGDRGVVDDQGRIRLVGRLKSEINRAGMKISPEEIDLLLERHPDVAEACTFGLPDDVSGEIVAAAIRLEPGATSDVPALRIFCTERIRREAVPERFFIVDEIPKSERGKLQRDTVRDACLTLAGTQGPT